MDTKTQIEFLCDRKRCKKCHEECTHTTEARFATNKKKYVDNPLRFLNDCCDSTIIIEPDEVRIYYREIGDIECNA